MKEENSRTVPIVFSHSQAQQPVVRWQGYYVPAVHIITDTGQERECSELQLTDHTPEYSLVRTKGDKAARISVTMIHPIHLRLATTIVAIQYT